MLHRTRSLLLVLLLQGMISAPFAAEIVTILGSGKNEFSGDGGPATKAGCGEPFGLVIGPDRALYVCETTNHVIRRLDEATGQLSTVAGIGRAMGYDGDGGPATKARLNQPYEIRFDSAGNMFFVEMKNHIVRRVDARTGIISTVAGTGKAGFSGDGGPATRAELSQPHSIVLDQNNGLLICDIINHRVRRVDLRTGIITTFAGTGQKAKTPDGSPIAGTPLNGPRALEVESNGNLILALREGNAIYRIDTSREKLFHLAGTGKQGYSGDGGNAHLAELAGPKGVAVNKAGDIFLVDTESHTIRVIRAKTGIIDTVVGDGQKGDGPDGDPKRCRLNRPHGVFIDDHDNVYIGDSSNNKVRKLTGK